MNDKKTIRPVTIDPVKLSQPAGASLAFMGIEGSVPMWHGVQGCTAFAKILFIQHFREPMPFQTTALTHVSVVMGGDANIGEAIDNIVGNDGVKFVGLHTTGVGETSGIDLIRVLKEYRATRPGLPVVGVNTSDYEGSLQTGYAKAVTAILEDLVVGKSRTDKKRVAVLAGPYLTPGEIEELRDWFEMFDLDVTILPDLGSSLGGYVTDTDFTPHSIGGTKLAEIATLPDVERVITIGRSMARVGQKFGEKWGIEVESFDHLGTLEEIDRFFLSLTALSGKPVPAKVSRWRRHLQDTVLDCQFYYNGLTAGIAGDPDFILRWRAPMEAMGVAVEAVSPIRCADAVVGDQTDLGRLVDEKGIDLLIGSSHVAELAASLELPVVRAGLPVYDRIGEPSMVRIGYKGLASLYREGANAIMERHETETPYLSPLQQSMR